MNRTYVLLVGLMLLVFAGVVARRALTSETPESTESRDEAVEKERIRQFWTLHREASDLRTAGDYEGAIARYVAALAIDPEHEDALYYVSNAYLELRRLRDAEATLNRLVRAHPTSSRGHSRLGDVHLCFANEELFDLPAAEAAFRSARRVNREETGPMLRLAELLVIDDRLAEAKELLEAITRTNFESIEGHYLLGFVHWRTGAIAEAGAAYDHAMTLVHAKEPSTKVIGEGDRKDGAAIRPGEQLTCPVVQDMLHDLVAGATGLEASYVSVQNKIENLRSRTPQMNES